MKKLFVFILFILATASCHKKPVDNPPVPPVTVSPRPTPGPFDYPEESKKTCAECDKKDDKCICPPVEKH